MGTDFKTGEPLTELNNVSKIEKNREISTKKILGVA